MICNKVLLGDLFSRLLVLSSSSKLKATSVMPSNVLIIRGFFLIKLGYFDLSFYNVDQFSPRVSLSRYSLIPQSPQF